MNESRALTERIAFAEEWLDRAKRHLADGNVAHGSLHLILAEAELHRAREVGATSTLPIGRRARRSSVARNRAAVGAVLVACFAAALLWTTPTERHAADGPDASWPVMVFPGQTGDMLRIVAAPGAPPEPTIVERTVERTIVKPVIVRVSVASPVQSASVAALAAPARAVAAPHATRTPDAPVVSALQPAHVSAKQPAAVEPAPAAPVLSDAEVIDLVLAAERSLRQPAKH